MHDALHKELLDNSLAELGLPGCSSFEVMQRFQSGSKFRLIVKAVTSAGPFVVKCFDDEDVTEEALQAHGLMSQCYLRAGVPVPRRYIARSGIYYTFAAVEDRKVTVTVEDFIEGSEVNRVSLEFMGEIGATLGKMHSATESAGIAVGNGSAWSLFVGTESDLLGEFDENSTAAGLISGIRLSVR